jgi:hypothetical protein
MSQYVDLEAECLDDAGDECMQSETEEDRAFIDDDVKEDYSPPPMDLFDSDDVIAPKKVTVIHGLGVVDGFDHGTYESKRTPSAGGRAEPAKKPTKKPAKKTAPKTAPKINAPTLKREPFPIAIARPICSSATPIRGLERVKLSKTLKRRRVVHF